MALRDLREMMRPWPGAVAAALFGAAMVLAAFGTVPLDPRNQAWLFSGFGVDPVQLWLGWTYFRHAAWGFPPGVNPDYGLELGTAIYFADAIPLLALPLKALRGILEVPQYIGPWLLACGVLQGLLAWCLLGVVLRHPLGRFCGAGLLVLQPMLLHRMTGHTPLAAQWTLLAGLLLALRPTTGARHSLAWVALLTVTSLVHSYLLAMLAALWAANWLRRAWPWPHAPNELAPGPDEKPHWPWAEAVAMPVGVLGALWAAGLFQLRSGFNTGPGHEWGSYGTWGFDLLAYVDGGMWSGLLPDLPDAGHWEAGSSYLGLGGILLLATGVLAWLRRPVALPRRLWPLATVLLVLLAFAATHRLTIAGHVWPLFTPPPQLLAALELLRNSERMVWPLSYALMLGAVALAVRAWGEQRTAWLLLVLLLLQGFDLRDRIADIRGRVLNGEAGLPQPLADPFWPAAAQGYARLRAVPTGNQVQGWEILAPFAAAARMPTDAIYMARVNAPALAALQAKTAAILASGAFEPGTLYVLRDAASLAQARRSCRPGRDLLRQADGIWVLAPHWYVRHPAPSEPGPGCN